MTTTPETLTAESMIAEALSVSIASTENNLFERRARQIAAALRTAGLLVTPGAPSSAPPLTDAEWREFQSIPDQGYSHRHWVDTKIAERVTTAGVATQEPSETIKCDRCGEPLPALADLAHAMTPKQICELYGIGEDEVVCPECFERICTAATAGVAPQAARP